MDYKHSVKFEYYEVVCRNIYDGPDSPDRLFDLSLFIEKADKLNFEQRKFEYFQEYARLDSIEYEESNNLWLMEFVRLRDTNIPSIAKDNQESEPIHLAEDEYIGENACVLYDEELHILMLQRNIHSLSPSGIEYYLNRVWRSEEQQIYLRPICPIELQNSIFNAAEYRKISIRIAKPKEIKQNDLFRTKTLKSVVDSVTALDANNAALEISIGRAKNDRLNKNETKDILADVYENRNLISGAKLTLRKTPDSTVDVIDLFEEKLHDYVPIILAKKESVLSERMKLVMLTQYKETKGRIIASINR